MLVVDDDANMRKLLRRVLEKEGWKVEKAGNRRVAFESISKARPAVILLDLMMLEMDGFQFIAELHKQKACRSIPVAVITGKDITPEDRRRLEGSVEKILKKGKYSMEELLLEVRDLVVAATSKGN